MRLKPLHSARSAMALTGALLFLGGRSPGDQAPPPTPRKLAATSSSPPPTALPGFSCRPLWPANPPCDRFTHASHQFRVPVMLSWVTAEGRRDSAQLDGTDGKQLLSTTLQPRWATELEVGPIPGQARASNKWPNSILELWCAGWQAKIVIRSPGNGARACDQDLGIFLPLHFGDFTTAVSRGPCAGRRCGPVHGEIAVTGQVLPAVTLPMLKDLGLAALREGHRVADEVCQRTACSPSGLRLRDELQNLGQARWTPMRDAPERPSNWPTGTTFSLDSRFSIMVLCQRFEEVYSVSGNSPSCVVHVLEGAERRRRAQVWASVLPFGEQIDVDDGTGQFHYFGNVGSGENAYAVARGAVIELGQ